MHIDYLKQGVTLDNQNLKQYIFDWIDAIYTNPKGFISEQGLNLAINELIDYSNNNISIMIDILKIAIKNGYRDITWAIQNYNRNNNTNNNFVQYSNIKSDWSNIVDEAF